MKRPVIEEVLSMCNDEYIDEAQHKYEKYIDVLENKIKQLNKKIKKLEVKNETNNGD